MTNKEVIEFLKQYALEKYEWELRDGDYHELLSEEAIVFEEPGYLSRHWQEEDRVVKIGEMFVRFTTAYTTDDMTPYEKGWEFDLDSIHEVERHEETRVVVTYNAKSAF